MKADKNIEGGEAKKRQSSDPRPALEMSRARDD